MYKLTHIFFFIFLIIICNCQNNTKKNGSKSDKWKIALFDTTFLDTQIKSVEFIEVEDPMLGGIIKQKKLDNNETNTFLLTIRNINYYGIIKCRSNFIIRMNFENDTLRLKV